MPLFRRVMSDRSKTPRGLSVLLSVQWDVKGDLSMIDIPVIGKVLGEAVKIGQYFKNKKEDEQMRLIADAFRRSVQANGGNCLKPEIGSEQDRLYSKMVAKGYLARVPFGYMLPEFVQHHGEGGHGSLY